MTEPVRTIETAPEVHEPEAARGRFLRKATRLFARLPFVRHLMAMFYALGDSETPLWAKGVITGAIAYFVLPTDMVPDILAGIGFTDDAAVVMTALKTLSSIVKPEHYARADAAAGRGPTG